MSNYVVELKPLKIRELFLVIIIMGILNINCDSSITPNNQYDVAGKWNIQQWGELYGTFTTYYIDGRQIEYHDTYADGCEVTLDVEYVQYLITFIGLVIHKNPETQEYEKVTVMQGNINGKNIEFESWSPCFQPYFNYPDNFEFTISPKTEYSGTIECNNTSNHYIINGHYSGRMEEKQDCPHDKNISHITALYEWEGIFKVIIYEE